MSRGPHQGINMSIEAAIDRNNRIADINMELAAAVQKHQQADKAHRAAAEGAGEDLEFFSGPTQDAVFDAADNVRDVLREFGEFDSVAARQAARDFGI